MSRDEKKSNRKIEKEVKKVEKGVGKEIREIEKEAHVHNLFPVLAGGLAVFFLMFSMVVAAPYMLLVPVPASYRASPYTDLEAQGRHLFLSYGCFYCHSQFVRPQDWGIGNTSLEGDFVYDSPHSLGTERTGPDLSQIGGMRSYTWNYFHIKDPRSTSPGSIMPNFDFLSDQDLEALIAYIERLGTENLNQMSYKPEAPPEYLDKINPYADLMMQVNASYDPSSQIYSGNSTLGDMWGQIFDEGKTIFARNCLSCHGCSGNSQGPYARHVVTQPANLHERIGTYPPGFYFDFWRVSEGVPGTAMPSWHLTLNETARWEVVSYVYSFVNGSIRTIVGDISDTEGDTFANSTHITPPIAGTQAEFDEGGKLFILYCSQCHGVGGQGDGPASNMTLGGYINPTPANFTESGSDFQLYGRYVWKVKEGVETTNMPPWKLVLSDTEIYEVILYVQAFSPAEDYNTKWGPMYTDSFARNLKQPSTGSSIGIDSAFFEVGPALPFAVFVGLLLWSLKTRHFIVIRDARPKALKRFNCTKELTP